MNLIKLISEGSMKAAALHLVNNKKFAELNKHPSVDALVAGCLRQILKLGLKNFIDNDLKEALASGLGEAWLRKVMNVQCNKWAVEALNLVAAEI